MARTIFVAIVLSVLAGAQNTRTKLFIDPASRWISIHDKDGSAAPGEFAIDVLNSCPAKLTVTDAKDSADYVALISRTGSSVGSVLIYAKGELVQSFKPGHTAMLRKVAERVCALLP
jgi:hypothetical protein